MPFLLFKKVALTVFVESFPFYVVSVGIVLETQDSVYAVPSAPVFGKLRGGCVRDDRDRPAGPRARPARAATGRRVVQLRLLRRLIPYNPKISNN